MSGNILNCSFFIITCKQKKQVSSRFSLLLITIYFFCIPERYAWKLPGQATDFTESAPFSIVYYKFDLYFIFPKPHTPHTQTQL